MNSRIYFLFLFAAIVLTPSCQEKDDRGFLVKVGDMAPTFSTQLTSGEQFSLQDHIGKVILLQFTASWCGVCRKEMPHLEKEIWQKYKNKGLVFIGIDRDEPIETVKFFARETGITYPLALDPNANIFSLYAEREAGITRNVLIDKEGKIVFLTRLFNQTEFDHLAQKIDKLLK